VHDRSGFPSGTIAYARQLLISIEESCRFRQNPPFAMKQL
jgi:hypothetical protein